MLYFDMIYTPSSVFLSYSKNNTKFIPLSNLRFDGQQPEDTFKQNWIKIPLFLRR